MALLDPSRSCPTSYSSPGQQGRWIGLLGLLELHCRSTKTKTKAVRWGSIEGFGGYTTLRPKKYIYLTLSRNRRIHCQAVSGTCHNLLYMFGWFPAIQLMYIIASRRFSMEENESIPSVISTIEEAVFRVTLTAREHVAT